MDELFVPQCFILLFGHFTGVRFCRALFFRDPLTVYPAPQPGEPGRI